MDRASQKFAAILVLTVAAGIAISNSRRKPSGAQANLGPTGLLGEDLVGSVDEDQPLAPLPTLPPEGLGFSAAALTGDGQVSQNVLALMGAPARSYMLGPYGKPTWQDPKTGKTVYYKPAVNWLSPLQQVTIFKLAKDMMGGPDRSVPSVVARKALEKVTGDGEYWMLPLSTSTGLGQKMSVANERLLMSSIYLANAAALQAGFKVGGNDPLKHLLVPAIPPDDKSPLYDPNERGLLVGRGYLQMPEALNLGDPTLKVGQRVELLAGAYKTSEIPYSRPKLIYAEPVVAKVVSVDGVGNPTVEIVASFQGKDVTPWFSINHRFRPGTRFKLFGPGSTTSGIRRIFPIGMA